MDGQVDFAPVGCDPDEIFMVWCRCTDATGATCPVGCPYNPTESCPSCEEVGDNPWEEIALLGELTVYDPSNGERKYQKRLKTGPITASPVAADGRIYCVGEDGRVVVIRAGDEFQQVSLSRLGAASLATPAISDGVIVFRTVKHLVAVGKK